MQPPRYVNSPAAIIYDPNIPDPILRTYLKILGLHWDMQNPPHLKFEDWITITGNSRATLYGHLAFLGTSGWLLFSTAQDGTIQFSFTTPTPKVDLPGLSKILDVNDGHSKTLDIPPIVNSLIKNDSIESLVNAEVQNSGQVQESGLKMRKGKPLDPLLDNEAVKLYRGIMHLTANETQRQWIVQTVTDLELWRATLEHWRGHGWNPSNASGMLDSYKRGGKKACSLCNRKDGANPKTTGAIARAREELNRGKR